MTTKKAREGWLEILCAGMDSTHGEFFDCRMYVEPKEGTIRIREVLEPEPITDDEINAEVSQAFIWADSKLKTKHPAIAYEWGVKAGIKWAIEEMKKRGGEK